MKKSFLSSLFRRLLPYRLHYVLFDLIEDMNLLRLSLKNVERNARQVAGVVSGAKNQAMDYPGKGSSLNHHELSVFSQNGEDGILLYLFARLGVTNRTFVEFGVEDGRECNAANLAVNHDWSGLLMDGSEQNVAAGRLHYDSRLGASSSRVRFVQAFVTADNINQLLAEQNVHGEIDLLSIDIDGNDYWVWKAIEQIDPRVVVIEYNASFGPERQVTIPYRADFVWNARSFPDLFFTGASLSLLNRLGEEKGYILVGCDSNGVNAFFVRKDVASGKLAPVSPREAYFPHAVRTARFGVAGQEEAVSRLDLFEP